MICRRDSTVSCTNMTISTAHWLSGVTVEGDNWTLDKLDLQPVYIEVTFAIGSQFTRHTLDDSEPIADWQGNKKRVPYCRAAIIVPNETKLVVGWQLERICDRLSRIVSELNLRRHVPESHTGDKNVCSEFDVTVASRAKWPPRRTCLLTLLGPSTYVRESGLRPVRLLCEIGQHMIDVPSGRGLFMSYNSTWMTTVSDLVQKYALENAAMDVANIDSYLGEGGFGIRGNVVFGFGSPNGIGASRESLVPSSPVGIQLSRVAEPLCTHQQVLQHLRRDVCIPVHDICRGVRGHINGKCFPRLKTVSQLGQRAVINTDVKQQLPRRTPAAHGSKMTSRASKMSQFRPPITAWQTSRQGSFQNRLTLQCYVQIFRYQLYIGYLLSQSKATIGHRSPADVIHRVNQWLELYKRTCFEFQLVPKTIRDFFRVTFRNASQWTDQAIGYISQLAVVHLLQGLFSESRAASKRRGYAPIKRSTMKFCFYVLGYSVSLLATQGARHRGYDIGVTSSGVITSNMAAKGQGNGLRRQPQSAATEAVLFGMTSIERRIEIFLKMGKCRSYLYGVIPIPATLTTLVCLQRSAATARTKSVNLCSTAEVKVNVIQDGRRDIIQNGESRSYKKYRGMAPTRNIHNPLTVHYLEQPDIPVASGAGFSRLDGNEACASGFTPAESQTCHRHLLRIDNSPLGINRAQHTSVPGQTYDGQGADFGGGRRGNDVSSGGLFPFQPLVLVDGRGGWRGLGDTQMDATTSAYLTDATAPRHNCTHVQPPRVTAKIFFTRFRKSTVVYSQISRQTDNEEVVRPVISDNIMAQVGETANQPRASLGINSEPIAMIQMLSAKMDPQSQRNQNLNAKLTELSAQKSENERGIKATIWQNDPACSKWKSKSIMRGKEDRTSLTLDMRRLKYLRVNGYPEQVRLELLDLVRKLLFLAAESRKKHYRTSKLTKFQLNDLVLRRSNPTSHAWEAVTRKLFLTFEGLHKVIGVVQHNCYELADMQVVPVELKRADNLENNGNAEMMIRNGYATDVSC
ncbi:hypothetical protein PR048_020579 [Dryococelus australis]|uniref:Uncharacterized protein n=1 Tax=Dryococelus australis TaxID=614101 RepID=A0ABQ9H6R7_9NEOP|nr:hypothetical protein PR048_020579 [Dryococelus australis]